MKFLRTKNVFKHTAANFLKHETGSAYVESCVTLACFLIIIFGSMELCSAAYTYTVLADAANEGLHYAVLNSSDETGAVNMVKDYAKDTLHNVSKIDVAVTYPDGTTSPPARVAVSVTYPYVPYLTLFMSNPPAMHAYAEGTMVR